jgi:hypothetical protein
LFCMLHILLFGLKFSMYEPVLLNALWCVRDIDLPNGYLWCQSLPLLMLCIIS